MALTGGGPGPDSLRYTGQDNFERLSMTLFLKTLPVVELEQVYHVGSLRREHKGRQGPSQEGAGLSVSLHPREWTHIARLGGNPTFVLTKPGGRFLDRHALALDTELRFKEWGVAQGWLQPCTRWKVEWYDSEADARVHCLMASEEAAHNESAELEDAEPTVTEVDAVALTASAVERLGFDCDPLLALNMVVTFYVEDCTTLDGVWWSDALDPMGLSAPRGVICAQRLAQWQCRKQAD